VSANVRPPWTCDKCGGPIKTVEDGWVQWTPEKASIVHNREGCVYADEDRWDGHLAWFAPGVTTLPLSGRLQGLDRLLYAIEEDGMPVKDGFEIIRRLHVPGYESRLDIDARYDLTDAGLVWRGEP
jgi:hypothetical protein